MEGEKTWQNNHPVAPSSIVDLRKQLASWKKLFDVQAQREYPATARLVRAVFEICRQQSTSICHVLENSNPGARAGGTCRSLTKTTWAAKRL